MDGSEDTRLAVFDFEEHLLLDTIDIIGDGEQEAGLLKAHGEEKAKYLQEEATPTARSLEDPTQQIAKKLQNTVQVMTSKVEQLQREVLQVTRVRSILKREKLQRNNILKDRALGSFGNKKPRLFDAARSEAAKRKKMLDLLRLCGNILRQLMQHKWAWPFMQPVDVEGLKLHDYYRVIRRPMDLGTIRSRLEAKDGTGYRHVQELCEDVRLVFRNAMLYNESWSDVYKMAKTLRQKFEEKWKVAIEPRLLEEEERSCEDQQDGYLLDIAELHAGEEQAAEQLGEDVLLQLSDVEKKMEAFLMQVLSKCRTMGAEEKKELYRRLCRLPPASLNRVIEILSLKNSHAAATDKIQIDLEVLDSSILWRLHFFVKMVAADTIHDQKVEKKQETEGYAAGPSHAI